MASILTGVPLPVDGSSAFGAIGATSGYRVALVQMPLPFLHGQHRCYAFKRGVS